MPLRPDNAAAGDVDDLKTVLAAALRRFALPPWPKGLVRLDGAAFSHALPDRLTVDHQSAAPRSTGTPTSRPGTSEDGMPRPRAFSVSNSRTENHPFNARSTTA